MGKNRHKEIICIYQERAVTCRGIGHSQIEQRYLRHEERTVDQVEGKLLPVVNEKGDTTYVGPDENTECPDAEAYTGHKNRGDPIQTDLDRDDISAPDKTDEKRKKRCSKADLSVQLLCSFLNQTISWNLIRNHREKKEIISEKDLHYPPFFSIFTEKVINCHAHHVKGIHSLGT